jgi:hypothetical protein
MSSRWTKINRQIHCSSQSSTSKQTMTRRCRSLGQIFRRDVCNNVNDKGRHLDAMSFSKSISKLDIEEQSRLSKSQLNKVEH